MSRLATLLAALLLTVLPAVARPPLTYEIKVTGSLPNDPLMGFNIQIANGRIARLPNIPAAWVINLVNDSDWQTTIEGHAIEGSSSITTRTFSGLFLIGGIPPDIKDTFKGATTARGKLTFMGKDGEPFTVDAPRIGLVPLASNPR